MDGRVGDRIIVEATTSSSAKRSGLIEEVLAGERPRYAVRWEDGRTRIFSPSAGSARIVAARARKRKTSKSGASSPKKPS